MMLHLLKQSSMSSLRRCYTNVNKAQLESKMLGGTVLIDVRNKDEITETGPFKHGPNTGKNVPLPELEEALKLGHSDFKNRYGFEKPKDTQEIVFTCRAGRRSVAAAQIAEKLGYKNVVNYTGGSCDWFNIPYH